MTYSLAIHGGAGTILKSTMTPEREAGYRAGLARALEAGDQEAGCSVHLVTPELDGGPVLGQVRVPIKRGETEQTLAARVLEQEHRLYHEVLRQYAQGHTTPMNFD